MSDTENRKLFVCYIPGADLRRLNPANAPYMAGLLQSYPMMVFTRGFPTTETLSTIITGARPNEHGVWQATLRSDGQLSWMDRVMDALPDPLTTTVQCVLYQLGRFGEMPTIPPRRRRRLEFRRVKFRGSADTSEMLTKVGDVESVFRIIGATECSYRFSDQFHARARLLQEAVSGTHKLEILQFHGLDVLSHWRLDNEQAVRQYYRLTDAFVRELHEKCQARGVTMVLSSDHGQETVRGTVDLRRALRGSGVPEDEYTVFIEVMMARFWFHSPAAREALTRVLSKTPHGRVAAFEEFGRYRMDLADGRYGEVFFLMDPGYTIFPHDFYHPVVNCYFGLKDWQQRRRAHNPRHYAYHGYATVCDAEKGFMTVLDHRYRTDGQEHELIDMAPSLLGLLGYPKPASMSGHPRFHR
ncbi:MAG: alkaline phosphatase family protein [Candidatus Omnitrophica bacterium]|nr:alkaline phosphatase family protein [Candidatus Omnitrophota bacterium]